MTERALVRYGTTEIAYQLRRTGRQKTVSIAVDPEEGVLVTAPQRAAAIHALAAANTPRAREILATLAKDRDADVREMVGKALEGSGVKSEEERVKRRE